MLHILQTIPVVPPVNADSLAAKREQITQTILTTPPNELLANLGQQAIQFGLKVLAALLIYILGAWLIRVVRRLVRNGFRRRETEPTLASFVDSLVSISMWVILVVITISTLGINTTSLAALLAAGGMAIGMAMSGTVQNFAGGLMLLIFKPFKVGDFIEAQGFMGVVKEVTIVNTKLLTTDNRMVILPNGALSNGNINNITTMPLRRVDLNVSVAYGTDVAKAKECILTLIQSNPVFLDSTVEGCADPMVALMSLGDSSINLVVRAWVKTTNYWPAYFWLTENVYNYLPKNGVSFPFPQLDVHLKQ